MYLRLNQRLKRDRSPAPALRFHIRNGLGKVPEVAVKVSCVVLALSIHVIHRLGKNDGAVLPCALAVRKRVYDAHLGNVRTLRHDVALGDCEAAFAGAHLDTVVCDPKPHCKSKRSRKPFSSHRRIGVDENWDDGARGNRAVGAHDDNLAGSKTVYLDAKRDGRDNREHFQPSGKENFR